MNNNAKMLWGALAIVVLVILGTVILNKPDDRAVNERVGDAISNMDARELQDRTPAERIGDAVNDATDDVAR